MADTSMEAPASNVTAFPDAASRSWRWIRDGLHELYREQGVSDDVLKPSLDTVGEIYKRLRDNTARQPFPPGAGPDEWLMIVELWVRDVSLLMLTEIAVREFELRQAGLRD